MLIKRTDKGLKCFYGRYMNHKASLWQNHRPVFLNLLWYTAAPFLSKKNWRHPYIVKLLLWGTLEESYWWISLEIPANSERIQYLAAPLGPLHGTLVCRGTPVENHCLKWLRNEKLWFDKLKKLCGEFINVSHNNFAEQRGSLVAGERPALSNAELTSMP